MFSAAFLLFILLAVCCFPSSKSSYDPLPLHHAAAEEVFGETITDVNPSFGRNIAGGNFTRTAFSFARMAEKQHSIRSLGRSFFNSVFAVLFKTAVIPTILSAVFSCAEEPPEATRERIISYMHDADGKKGRRSFLPVSQ